MVIIENNFEIIVEFSQFAGFPTYIVNTRLLSLLKCEVFLVAVCLPPLAGATCTERRRRKTVVCTTLRFFIFDSSQNDENPNEKES